MKHQKKNKVHRKSRSQLSLQRKISKMKIKVSRIMQKKKKYKMKI